MDRSYLPVYQQLSTELTGSTAAQRLEWATFIINQKVPLEGLFPLMQNGEKSFQYFLYLMSDIAWNDPDYLLKSLPALVSYFKKELNKPLPPNFATYWLKCGIPEEMEGIAVDNLFRFLVSGEVTSQRKLHAAEVLTRIQKKYPDLKTELELILNDLLQGGSPSFQKKIRSLLCSI